MVTYIKKQNKIKEDNGYNNLIKTLKKNLEEEQKEEKKDEEPLPESQVEYNY